MADDRAARAQLSEFLSRFDAPVRRDAERALKWMRKVAPGALERVYDAYNALAIGFAAGDSLRETFAAVVVYPKHVNLGFNQGASLDDPRGILVGEGKAMRHVRASAEMLGDPYVADLARAAAAHAGFTPERGARGTVKIAAVYPRRRARTPKKKPR